MKKGKKKLDESKKEKKLKDKEQLKKALQKASENIDLEPNKEKDFTNQEFNAEKEFFDSIGGFVEHKNYKNIKKYIEMITIKKDRINGLILCGENGIGKSTMVKSVLKSLKINFVYLNSYTTSLSFYKQIYHNRESVILLDDLSGIYKDEKGISILKALLNTEEVRFVNYQSTSEKLDVPSQFIFKGSIIILVNALNKDINKGVRNRVICRTINFTLKEKLDLTESIIKFNHKKLKGIEILEIINFIKENVSEVTKEFSFRTIEKIVEFFKFDKQEWKELALEELETDEELIILKEIMENNKNVQYQIEKWIEKTGKSRRTFFRRKKRLLSAIMP